MAETMHEDHQAILLTIFSKLTEGKVSAGDLKKKITAATKKATSPDDSEVDQALAGLIEEGLISATGGAKDGPHPRPNTTYRLTDKGKQHIRPKRPENVPGELLGNQAAFIQLLLYRVPDRTLTRSKLNEKLNTRSAAVNLFDYDLDDPKQKEEAKEKVDYHLFSLVEKGYLDEKRSGVSVRYTLNEEGCRSLSTAKQHETASVTLDGKTLNALLAAARESISDQSRAEQAPVPAQSVEVHPAPSSRYLNEQDIAKYIAQLRSDRYAGKDLIPIHEVRRLVAEHHGAEAAAHPVFDPLIKRMRSEEQLELIAISDNRGATQEQLDASIPGMNETIFYIVVE